MSYLLPIELLLVLDRIKVQWMTLWYPQSTKLRYSWIGASGAVFQLKFDMWTLTFFKSSGGVKPIKIERGSKSTCLNFNWKTTPLAPICVVPKFCPSTNYTRADGSLKIDTIGVRTRTCIQKYLHIYSNTVTEEAHYANRSKGPRLVRAVKKPVVWWRINVIISYMIIEEF